MTVADPRATARFLGAFFDELAKWGVENVVISPGSRSTPLSMTAYELSCRAPQRMSTYVDIDERGAAFLALGMAKASGRPAALVCSSGTAIANYYPAILEAESSRVPLIVLTADRPPQLQGLGAPQTCDQSHAYGTHVRAYRGMPLPADDEGSLRFARQAAREACIAALGSCELPQNPSSAATHVSQRLAGTCFGGPVHLNFPFDEPLKPDVTLPDLFDAGIPCTEAAAAGETPGAKPARKPLLPVGIAQVRGGMEGAAAAQLARELLANNVLLLAGEGSCATHKEAQRVLAFARAFAIPVLADPLSGLRSLDDPLVIGNYDSVFQPGGISPDDSLNPQVIVRFGRYPVSKRATQWARAREDAGVLQVVVDPLETRDTNAATTVFVRMKPADFAQSMERALRTEDGPAAADANDLSFANAWQRVEEAAAKRIAAVDAGEESGADGFEGAYVRRVLELAPEGSCLFAANSMSVRAVDTFYLKGGKQLTVLANRGLNGIDGTVSTAIGASRYFGRTTLITGDLTIDRVVSGTDTVLTAPGSMTDANGNATAEAADSQKKANDAKNLSDAAQAESSVRDQYASSLERTADEKQALAEQAQKRVEEAEKKLKDTLAADPKADVTDLQNQLENLRKLRDAHKAVADQARKNIDTNRLSAQFAVLTGDLREYRTLLQANTFDAVVSNPPYFPAGSGAVSPEDARAVARSELCCTPDDLCACNRIPESPDSPCLKSSADRRKASAGQTVHHPACPPGICTAKAHP